jgi:hypothetical protein
MSIIVGDPQVTGVIDVSPNGLDSIHVNLGRHLVLIGSLEHLEGFVSQVGAGLAQIRAERQEQTS